MPTALKPPIQVDFLGTKPKCPITGTSSLASISTMSILLGVITASAPFSKALKAPRIISSAVTNSFNTKAAVKNKFFEPSLTGITFFAFDIIISNPAFSAASASSMLFAVTCVNFLFPLAVFKSPTVKVRFAGLAAHV